MFARTKKTVKVQGSEESYDVTICKLSDSQLEEAATTQALKQAAQLRAMGGDVLKGLKEADAARVAAALDAKPKKDLTPEERRQQRDNSFDRQTVLRKGVVSWTAPEKVDFDSIEKLERVAALQLHQEILDLSLGPLDAEESAAAPKGA